MIFPKSSNKVEFFPLKVKISKLFYRIFLLYFCHILRVLYRFTVNHQNVVAFQIRTFNDLFAKKEGGISLNNSSLTTLSVIASYCTM